jgi:hypothetical protein
MDPQPQAVVATESTFPRHAARASWLAALLAAIGSNFVRPHSPLAADALSLLLIVVGLGLSLIALFGIGRAGKKGVLVPATIGLLLNLGLITVFVSNFMGAYNRAHHGG